MKSPRFWAIMLLVLLAAYVLHRRGDKDRVPPSTPLSEFPHAIGPWTGKDFSIPTDTLEVLGHGEFVNRIYTIDREAPATGLDNTPASPDAIGLLIAYFPTQRTGQSIHSPQHCLPGAGWTFTSSGTTDIPSDGGGKPFQVGDYLISNGNAKAEVLYWYQTHGRAIASDYQAKLSMLADSIRYNRTDTALIRIVVPVAKGESRQIAHDRAVAFARRTIPLLPAYVPD